MQPQKAHHDGAPNEYPIEIRQRMQPDDKLDSELTEQIVEKEDELDSLLSDKAKEILEQMRDKQLDMSTSNERKAYISGFRLGARIMLETMDESDTSSVD